MNEFSQKQDQIRALLAKHQLDALLLQQVSSFAWATCGAASYVNTAASNGAACLLVTPSGQHLITNNIEAPRLAQEEGLEAQGWEFHAGPWFDSGNVIGELAAGLKLGADSAYPGAANLGGEMARLRANLGPEEGDRFRALGRICAEAMDAAIRALKPGQTEVEIAGILAKETFGRGAQPIVNLIATDERIFAYRHPLPTGKRLDRYAMLVLCGRKHGLVCSITRLIHFGPLPEAVRARAAAVAEIDATFIAATRPGETLSKIVQRVIDTYARTGYPDEWRLHHQGGPAGYEPREYLGTPSATDIVRAGQAYAWNPSITGAKSEDTILIGETANEVLTTIPSWPKLTVMVDGQQFERPAILEVG